MRTLLRYCLFLLVLASIVFTISLPANANSVTVTGNSDMGNNNEDLSVRAGILSAYVTVPGDLGPSDLGGGTIRVPMTLSWGFSGLFTPGYASVNVGNRFTDFAFASFLFNSSLFRVSSLALANGTITIPVTLSGELLAYQDRNAGVQGPLMASLQFAGKGTATLTLEDKYYGTFLIRSANVEFHNIKGTLTTVPEPSSLFLFGTGLSGMALIWKRRRDVRHAGRTNPGLTDNQQGPNQRT